jgi:hypothetical protein
MRRDGPQLMFGEAAGVVRHSHEPRRIAADVAKLSELLNSPLSFLSSSSDCSTLPDFRMTK